jgi:excisionase family DNA binding protein
VDSLLSYREVAQTLNVSLSTVTRYARDGLITPIKLGKRTVRFNPEEIKRLRQGKTG